MSFIGIMIAIALITAVIWLAFQPRQGHRADNTPDSHPTYPPEDTSKLPLDLFNLDDQELSAKQARIATEARRLLAQEQYIPALKYVRQELGYGLKEAKQYIKALAEHDAIVQDRAEIEPEVRQLLAQNRKIEAIKYVRTQLGYGLKEAKTYVDSLEG